MLLLKNKDLNQIDYTSQCIWVFKHGKNKKTVTLEGLNSKFNKGVNIQYHIAVVKNCARFARYLKTNSVRLNIF